MVSITGTFEAVPYAIEINVIVVVFEEQQT